MSFIYAWINGMYGRGVMSPFIAMTGRYYHIVIAGFFSHGLI